MYRDPFLLQMDALLDGPEADEAAWYDGVRHALEGAYLNADNPRAQSGFSGDEVRWERTRRPIAAALHRDGDLLDIGCASGHLMETLQNWAALDGKRIEPYGLDISADLAELARRRLPQWADRIFTGNAMEWPPPRRFDYVRTELVYVPERRQPELVERLLRSFLAPGGRAILCSYGSSRRPIPRVEPIGDMLRSWGFTVTGETEAAELNGVTVIRAAWIDAPGG
ncbi:MAG: class I SAM-dependent methyltransferase [Chloroflexi bacterium]|nr:class I SAM-dependent methyltransferase [Chloroflexota bacterium]